LFAAEHGLSKLGIVIEPWGDISREMILGARKTIDEALCKESEVCLRFAASLYQTLVSAILLRPHPTDVSAPLLPATSHIRVQVEQT